MHAKSDQQAITRRTALSMGAGFMLPLAGWCKASGSVQPPYDGNLFAFKAAKSESLVIAVTFVDDSASIMNWRESQFLVRLHVNHETWTISGPRPLQANTIPRSLGDRTFAGRLPGPDASGSARYKVAVLESHTLSNRDTLQVWAEIFDQYGTRFRVGNPFAAKLSAGDSTLSKIYHASSPDEDRALLSDVFGKRIAVMAAAGGGVADPDAHGRRLAELLLPDVMSYRPAHPAGFTFASRNGRHPADNTAAVVSTVLKGVVTTPAASMPFRVCQEFPYLLPPAPSV